MAIDLRQFHQTFFEESVEGVAAMEAELLELERGLNTPGFVPDPEQLNRIFRVVHSIKGGSGTFGFPVIADFSHLLESLLDDIRASRRPVNPGIVALLLRAVDGLRELIRSAHTGDSERGAIADVRAELEAIQPGGPAAADINAAAPERTDETGGGWHIKFRP